VEKNWRVPRATALLDIFFLAKSIETNSTIRMLENKFYIEDGGATDSEVKQAFRNNSKDYHLDIIFSLNLPDDFKKLAEKRFSALKTAYDNIMEHRRTNITE